MGNTSWQVQQKYKRKTYDQFNLQLKKGMKNKLKEYAQQNGMSLTELIIEGLKKVTPNEIWEGESNK